MGVTHTLDAPADWQIPTGLRLSNNTTIIEQVAAETHGDSLGDWARLVNSLYEYTAQPLIADTWFSYGATAGAPSWETVGRYKIPTWHKGTNQGAAGDIEGLRLQARAALEFGAGATGTIKLTTDDDSDTCTTISSTEATLSIAKVDLLDDETDQDVLIEAQLDSADTLYIKSLRADWYAGDATLPDGPYARGLDGFIPLSIVEYATVNRPVSVARMQYLLQDLRELYERRSADMIVTKYFRGATMPQTTSGQRLRVLAWQRPGVTDARVWLYGSYSGSGANSRVTVRLGDQVKTLDWVSTTNTWQRLDFSLDPIEGVAPLMRELIVTDVTHSRIRGVCAWWRRPRA